MNPLVCLDFVSLISYCTQYRLFGWSIKDYFQLFLVRVETAISNYGVTKHADSETSASS